MQIVYFSFNKIQFLLSFQWQFIFSDHELDCMRDEDDKTTITNHFLEMVEFSS